MLLHLHIEDYMLPCFTKKIFGFDCPGCGLQRSIAFLFQGDFSAAFDMYPAIFTLIPLFGLLIVDLFLKTKYISKITPILMMLSATLIIVNYIFKFI